VTEPNAEEPLPAVDPWADSTTEEQWSPAAAPAAPVVGAAAPAEAGGPQYSPGMASVSPTSPTYTTEVYSGQRVYPPYQGATPEPPRRNNRTIAIVAGVLAVLLVAAGIVFLPKLFSSSGNSNQTQPPTNAATASGSPSATAPTPPDLFAGTPAASFKGGADAIVLPAAKAVTGFTQAQVATDLTAVKNAMVAARLDPTMLSDHDPSTLIGLLAQDGRATVQKNFTDNTAFAYATRLDDGVTLTSDPIRVKGTITFSSQKVDNLQALVVVSNFIWVYPVSAHRTGVGANLIVVRDQVSWTFYTGVQTNSAGLWIKRARAFGSNLDCKTITDTDMVALAPASITEADTEAGDVYNLDPNLNFDSAHFVC
jgi:hypothetical protein